MKANRAMGIRMLVRSLHCTTLLLAVISAFAQPAGAQGCLPNVSTVAQLQAAAAGGGNICISAGTYNLASPLELDTPLGTNLTIQSAGDGPVILHSTTRDDIIQTGFNSSSLNPPGTFVINGLTFSSGATAINHFGTFIRVEDCTFVDNALGFYTDRDDAEVELVNDTLTQNGAGCNTNLFCGGIRLDFHKSFKGTNLTIADNQPLGFYSSGGGPEFIKDELTNSILAGNFTPGFGGADCFGILNPLDSSIDSDGSCGGLPGVTTIARPMLGLAALADNGGLVTTMALEPTSPAVGAGAACPTRDARGAFRGNCDIGAFERSRAFELGGVIFTTDVGTFVNFHAVDPNSLPQAGRPAGVTFPFGLSEWKIIDLNPGQTAMVTIQFPGGFSQPPQYWKVYPGGVWDDYCRTTASCVKGGLFALQFPIIDGAFGDTDGMTNREIRDPGGLGLSGVVPSLSINDRSVPEGNSGATDVTFTVTLSPASTQTVTVGFTTADGSAKAGDDYQASLGSLTFNPGETTKTITVKVNGDLLNEPDETSLVRLRNATEAVIAKAEGVGTIIDDDPLSLSIDDVRIGEGNSGATTANFTVTLSPASTQFVTVRVATAVGTASTADNDYVANARTLFFNPGTTSGTFSVTIQGDAFPEPDETFFVNLSNANAPIAKAQGVGTIVNDDTGFPNVAGPQFQANTFALGDQFNPAVGMNSSGRFVLAWVSDGQDGSGYGVFSQLYDADGNPVTGEFRVNTTTAGKQGEIFGVDAAMDMNGNFVVVWEGVGSCDNSGTGIFAQRFDAMGTPQGAEFCVNETAQGDQREPRVAMSPAGNFLVTWTNDADLGIYARRFDADGTPTAGLGQFRVNTVTTGFRAQPAIAMDENANFVVAWITNHLNPSQFAFDVFARRFSASGVAQETAEFKVNSTTQFLGRPDAGMDEVGNFVIAWHGFDGNFFEGNFGRRYDSAGMARGAEFRVESLTSDVLPPALAMNATGHFVVVWPGRKAPSSATRSIFARTFDDTGTARGNEFRVDATIANSTLPAVGMDSCGSFAVAWTAMDSSGGGVFARKFGACGNTPVGMAVSVQPMDATTGTTPVMLTFAEVTQAGDTMLATSSTGPATPAGFVLGSPAVYYELTTTATFSGSITVCINYAGITFPSGNPRLFHFESGTWVDVTVSVDTVNMIICGVATSLSPFAVFAPAPAGDTTPPVLSLPANITAEATGPNGAAVSYVAAANDDVDGPVEVSCTHDSGSVFPLGTTTVNCSAGDAAGHFSTGSFDVTVVDTTPPTISCPADITAEATSAAGAVVGFAAIATDTVDGDAVTSSYTAPPSGVFPLGTTVVTATAIDSAGNSSSCSFTVTVRDTTPPVLTLARTSFTVTLPTPSATGAAVDVLAVSGAQATDAVDGSVSISHNGPATFALGTTVVTITATDDAGNASQKQFTVNVVFDFGGFLAPVRTDGSSIFKSGSAIAVKFQLFADNGEPITNAMPTLHVFKIADAVLGTVEEIAPDAAGGSNTDNLFRYDATSQQYIYNLKTTGYTKGAYLLRAALGDGTQHDALISIR